MGSTPKKLGEAELEIMQVIWHSTQPVTSNYIEVPDIVLENDGMPGDELFESDLRQQLEDMEFVEAQGDENENTALLIYNMEGK